MCGAGTVGRQESFERIYQKKLRNRQNKIVKLAENQAKHIRYESKATELDLRQNLQPEFPVIKGQTLTPVESATQTMDYR